MRSPALDSATITTGHRVLSTSPSPSPTSTTRLSMDGGRAAAGGAGPSPVAASPHPTAPSSTPVDVSSFTHTPCYCEENIYMLCKELMRIGVADLMGTDLYVVFISNEEKKVPLWHQKASNSDDGFICWDYHVICIQSRRNKGEVLDLVWDLDSDLPFPSPFSQYVSDAIQPLAFGDSIYRRLFRVIHAPLFLQSFASDRSHMKDPAGNWIQLPPKYDPIVAADGTTNNLHEYIAMSVDDVADLESMVNDVYSNNHGVVLNETILPRFFSRLPHP